MTETFIRMEKPDVPPEQSGNAIYGSIMHLGSPLTCVVALAIVGVTPFNAIVCFLAISLVFTSLTLLEEKRHASLDLATPTSK